MKRRDFIRGLFTTAAVSTTVIASLPTIAKPRIELDIPTQTIHLYQDSIESSDLVYKKVKASPYSLSF